jgi:hypothetical protein
MHHRLAKALEMEFAHPGELVNQAGEALEWHERGRAVRRPIGAKLDRAHLAAEVALAHWFDLDECWQIHTGLDFPAGRWPARLSHRVPDYIA